MVKRESLLNDCFLLIQLLRKSNWAIAECLCLCREDNRAKCTLGQISHTRREGERERRRERRRRLQLCRVWFQLACSTIPLCLSLGPQRTHENVRSVLVCVRACERMCARVCVHMRACPTSDEKEKAKLVLRSAKNVHGTSHCDSLLGREEKDVERCWCLPF